MESANLGLDASLKLLREGGIFGRYWRTLALWLFLYAVTTFDVVRFAYYHGTLELKNGVLLVEIALAAAIGLNTEKTHGMYKRVRAIVESDSILTVDRSLLAQTFWRAFYNLGGLVIVLSAANLCVLALLREAQDGKLF